MASQFGVVSYPQVRECGVTARQQRRLVDTGVWSPYAPSVIRDAAREDSWEMHAMAATLAPGAPAVLAGATAARLHGLDGFADVERIIVMIPDRARVRVRTDVTVVRAKQIDAQDVTMVRGIPTLEVAATLVSLARVGHSGRAQALDAALRGGTSPGALREQFERLCGRGARGPREMLGLLHERVEARLPRSWFQRLATEMLQRHGIAMVDEWPVRDERGRLLAELDLANVDLQVGVECQSWAWHSTPRAQRADTERKRRLRSLGWDILDLWWSDLERCDAVIADVLLAIRKAERLRQTGW